MAEAPRRPMTNAHFAELAARIAARAAGWAGDALTMRAEVARPIWRADALRFVADIRRTLQSIEEASFGNPNPPGWSDLMDRDDRLSRLLGQIADQQRALQAAGWEIVRLRKALGLNPMAIEDANDG